MRGVLFTIVGLAMLPAAAHADFTTHPLDGHADSIAAPFTGNELFLSTVGTDTLDIRVDYAVFAPGVFQSIAGAVYTPFVGPGVGPTDYVYAYQIYNQGTVNGTGTEAMTFLTIGLAGGTVLSVGQETGGAIESSTDAKPPVGGFSLLNSVLYSYAGVGNDLLTDTFSTVLLFTSPNAPAFANASVEDGGLSAVGMLPSPVPEPGAALLGFLGLGLVGAVKRRLA